MLTNQKKNKKINKGIIGDILPMLSDKIKFAEETKKMSLLKVVVKK